MGTDIIKWLYAGETIRLASGPYIVSYSGSYRIFDNCIQLYHYEYEPKVCTCGTAKTYPNEPNLEFLHSDWCDLYKSNKGD